MFNEAAIKFIYILCFTDIPTEWSIILRNKISILWHFIFYLCIQCTCSSATIKLNSKLNVIHKMIFVTWIKTISALSPFDKACFVVHHSHYYRFFILYRWITFHFTRVLNWFVSFSKRYSLRFEVFYFKLVLCFGCGKIHGSKWLLDHISHIYSLFFPTALSNFLIENCCFRNCHYRKLVTCKTRQLW